MIPCPNCGNEITWEYFDGTNNPPMICFECGYVWEPTTKQKSALEIRFTKERNNDGQVDKD